MENIIHYVRKNLDSLSCTTLNEIDSLVFSTLAYLRFPDCCKPYLLSGVRLSELFRAEYFEEMLGFHNDLYLQLLALCAASPRFRDVTVCGYREITDVATEKQFAAICFVLNDSSIYVAYRGTDSSFTGWREDFNLALQCPVPSQAEAVNYLRTVSETLPLKLYVGGHSKGGNLAVYASAMNQNELQNRLLRVFSHDGPGFLSDTLKFDGFSLIRSKISKTVPQESIVGLLLMQETDYQIIKSSGRGFQQHLPFNWSIHDHHFESHTALSIEARLINAAINPWVEQMPSDEYQRFFDTFFCVLEQTQVDSFADISDRRKELIPIILKAASGLSPDTRKFLLQQIRNLAAVGIKNIPELIRNYEESERA